MPQKTYRFVVSPDEPPLLLPEKKKPFFKKPAPPSILSARPIGGFMGAFLMLLCLQIKEHYGPFLASVSFIILAPLSIFLFLKLFNFSSEPTSKNGEPFLGDKYVELVMTNAGINISNGHYGTFFPWSDLNFTNTAEDHLIQFRSTIEGYSFYIPRRIIKSDFLWHNLHRQLDRLIGTSKSKA